MADHHGHVRATWRQAASGASRTEFAPVSAVVLTACISISAGCATGLELAAAAGDDTADLDSLACGPPLPLALVAAAAAPSSVESTLTLAVEAATDSGALSCAPSSLLGTPSAEKASGGRMDVWF